MFYDLDMSYLRAADAAIRRAAAVAAEPRPLAEARLVAEAAAQGQEGCAAPGEARGGEDAPARHDHSARDGGQHGWRLQRQDLQPGGNQGACGMSWARGWGPATVPPLTIPHPSSAA